MVIVMNLNGIYATFVVYKPKSGYIRDKIVGDTNIREHANLIYSEPNN